MKVEFDEDMLMLFLTKETDDDNLLFERLLKADSTVLDSIDREDESTLSISLNRDAGIDDTIDY